ncbi:hypothetical protein QC761_506990 [Podospora bellae-mahoneyi]|uniref:Uncharacterized protein n=1 Tax=Podospora bellae-mahoneyi TaxID=2093777 RepID=A0ABR0FEN0_9PEZI|nr:hypothetical protein QC761_506990 [Podospora bellae-mahoneyi]
MSKKKKRKKRLGFWQRSREYILGSGGQCAAAFTRTGQVKFWGGGPPTGRATSRATKQAGPGDDGSSKWAKMLVGDQASRAIKPCGGRQ